ncbi:FeoA family protein [Parageobacillus thermoglucosidasius]|uniref:FeoA family protein n=1 Tax=Parageobacillus thermoglucosidasius TaxID=1426 RepID=UPI002E1F4D86|nr:FeoA family protein [Parageobacillus thermoglucosidasius]MED4913640.1 FeoA family protein [Parageobacillus thermoglucosidasius]MED4944964.1 FeoA family protein [Parageobacillus thermoglucosidasius]MED4983427.1 FeoA family protein [Parageobacillus thermoglucosidasius]
MVLTELQQGQQAVITHLGVTNEVVKQRLIHMGMHEGEKVCVKCVMPFGGPLMVEVDGQYICLRRKEAACIGVK